MDFEKNYYAILGVLPNAEEIVIRAAYKALAQRYHPDRGGETARNDGRKMAEINEAYQVLSDPAQRKIYDAARSKQNSTQQGFENFWEEKPKSEDPTEKDWQLALRFYPDLSETNGRLEKISWKLASGYRAYLIENKLFEKRKEIAAKMERGFLENYFGTDRTILNFASDLIQGGFRDAAFDLNQSIRVLGSNAPAAVVISTIKRSHPSVSLVADQQFRINILAIIIEEGQATFDNYQGLIRHVGGELTSHGFFSNKYTVTLNGNSTTFGSFGDLKPWFMQHVVPFFR